MVKCDRCGIAIKESMDFCYNCGSKIEKQLRCIKCNTILKKDADFCYNCGSKVSSAHSAKVPIKRKNVNVPKKEKDLIKDEENKDKSIGNRFKQVFSDLFNDDEEEEADVKSDEDDELTVNLDSISGKHLAIGASIIIVIIIALTWYSLSNKISDPDDDITSRPELRYNPSNNEAMVFVKDEKYIRNSMLYGNYVDIAFVMPSTSDQLSEDLFDKKKLEKTFLKVPYKNDVFLRDELPNDVNTLYPIFVRTPIPLNKTSKGYWESNKFEMNPIAQNPDAVFLIIWDKTDEFPYGSISPVSLNLARLQ